MNETMPSRMRWMLVGWVAVMGAISYLDRVNLSIAGPAIAREFHLSNVQLGWVFSAFAAGYCLFQIGGGWLADRFGPRRILTLGAVWWAAFTALTALVPAGFAAALLVFLLVRLMLGVGESVMYPSSNRWVASWMPVDERGLANGIIFAGVGAGAAVTPPLIAIIMSHYGWRGSFYSCALLGLGAAAVWYWLARDRPEQQPRVNAAELSRIHAGLPEPQLAGAAAPGWRVLLRSRDVWALTFSYFCYGYAAYIFFTWFYIYLVKVRGLNLQQGSLYAMLPFIAMSSCSTLGGWASDAVSRRWGRRWGRCGVAAFGTALAALFIALGSLAHSTTAAAIILAGGAGALYLSQSSYWALSADLGGAASGSLSGLMNMGAQSGSTITASLTPFIAGRLGWPASFLVAAAFCAAGSIAWLLVNPNRSLEPQPEPQTTV